MKVQAVFVLLLVVACSVREGKLTFHAHPL